MPPNSEIEKLERRWRENPKGTVFAPYAEVLRKNGDLLLAKDVLSQGLELHPDHIPGNIVLGRCCLDLGEDGPAEVAFAHVLDLDGENVIALKALADITERQGRLAEADGWLARLVAVDPSNEEARDQYARVNAARDAAAAALAAAPPVVEAAPAPAPAAAEATVEIPRHVLERAAQADRSEAGGGRISDAPAAPDMDLELEIPAPPAPPAAPVADLEAVDLDLSAIGEIESQPVAGMEVDQAFAPPSDAPPSIVDHPIAIGQEDREEIELRPSGGGEFQSPDASQDLLELTPGNSEYQVPDASAELLNLSPGQSEFQVPDASQDLRISSSGSSEFQTPSHAEDLLSRKEPEPETVESPAEAPASGSPAGWEGGVSPELADLAAMPTEEMASPPPASASALRAAESKGPPAWMLEEDSPAEEAPAPEPEPAASSPAAEAVSEPPPPAEPETVTAEAAEPAGVAEAGTEDQPAAELRLIFPDDAPEPEPHRMRRITEEAAAIPDEAPAAEAPEPDVGEPDLVVTESMAELYAEQGHTAEALRVYRVLAARAPHDARLQDRIKSLETRAAGSSRRMTYVAVDTGGESVESFFRTLAQARPGSGGPATPPPSFGDAGGAPTRPARDPLSLSAIFGEEPAQRSQARPETEPASAPAPGPDAFSFDQFFGGPASRNTKPSGPGRRSGASEEDLDQFQHWLKSLKK